MKTSYCKIHDTYPDDNEPCWQCVNLYIGQRDELLEALETVGPFVGRWHDRMAQLIGDMHDQSEEKFSLEEAGFFKYIEEARDLREVVRAAIAKVKGNAGLNSSGREETKAQDEA